MSFKASLIGIYEKKNINISFEYNTTNIQQISTLRSVLQYLCKHIFVNFDHFIVINLFYIQNKTIYNYVCGFNTNFVARKILTTGNSYNNRNNV